MSAIRVCKRLTAPVRSSSGTESIAATKVTAWLAFSLNTPPLLSLLSFLGVLDFLGVPPTADWREPLHDCGSEYDNNSRNLPTLLISYHLCCTTGLSPRLV